ncbi:RHS repeat-associated core domain-containing protein [Capnocytophaga genosp. AHN8471]|uniref:RHS repeat domain-containing protein n=1 Tax=Capnocytophaga genosp. AHN8471 TaxID=327574 RepID=UPI00293D8A1D|nr:RHS repeat-associated core domain-containing protein [Capnocytophaga genosp. AHN8471]
MDIAERRHFDAWGNITSYWNAEGKNTVPAEGILLDRGYTGHEHLLSVGLINMNARLYDPVLHRFLQPDNFVQDPFNTQNFNRYGYVLNNPLLYTDPTGEEFFTLTTLAVIGLGTIISSAAASWDTIEDWIKRNAKSTGQWFEKQGRSVGQWFSNQYNSIKEWFQGSGASSGVKNEYLTAEEVYKNQVWQIRPPTQHYFLGMNMTEMSEGNWFEQFVYNFFNDLSMPVQMMMGRSVGSSFAPMRNLNGTSMTTNDALLGFVNSASMGYSIALRGMTTGVEMTRAATPLVENTVAPRTISSVSAHATNQAITRGFKTPDILKIVREGNPVLARSKYGNLQWRYMMNGNTVIIDVEKNRIITIFSNQKGSAKKLGAGYINNFK